MSSIVSMEWVKEHRELPDVVAADCRFVLGARDSGRNAYEAGHLPGAVYFDLERDLSAPVGAHGGRHPLPAPELLADLLGKAGIGPSTRVVAYDDQGGAMASRLWWLLRYMGHRHVVVMDRGYSAWQTAGYPVSAERTVRQPQSFVPHVQTGWLADRSEVLSRLGRADTVLIDSRDPNRYLGREEPLDPVAGHIPGALNRFWKESLDESGSWKNAKGQKERFAEIPEEKRLIVYCGSGVTACPNVLSLMEAGYPNVKLYAGSWSDWISYSENPVATGEE